METTTQTSATDILHVAGMIGLLAIVAMFIFYWIAAAIAWVEAQKWPPIIGLAVSFGPVTLLLVAALLI